MIGEPGTEYAEYPFGHEEGEPTECRACHCHIWEEVMENGEPTDLIRFGCGEIVNVCTPEPEWFNLCSVAFDVIVTKDAAIAALRVQLAYTEKTLHQYRTLADTQQEVINEQREKLQVAEARAIAVEAQVRKETVAGAFLAATLGGQSYAGAADWLEAVAKGWWRANIPGELPWQETALGDMARTLKQAAEREAK